MPVKYKDTPQAVKDYCGSFTFCRGCHFECRAPERHNDFLKWHDEMCDKVLDHIKEKV